LYGFCPRIRPLYLFYTFLVSSILKSLPGRVVAFAVATEGCVVAALQCEAIMVANLRINQLIKFFSNNSDL
jgi:hypothetical protein